MLTESDTEFGKSIDKDTIHQWSADMGSQITQMKFPFHVSQVALALDEEQRKTDHSIPSLVRPSSRLTIPFDETGNPRETVPAPSPKMSTATSEFVLGKIFETISQEDFRYIGIVATDTRDTIFLAGLIHQFCPDVQVFVPDGDLLLAHPRYSAELRGLILASSYPLFSMVQRWDPPYKGDRRRRLFPSQDAEGTYNAALFLLHDMEANWGPVTLKAVADASDADGKLDIYDSLVDYGKPFEVLKRLNILWTSGASGHIRWSKEASWPITVTRNGKDRPPIWFSMVGPRGLWPLRFDDQWDQPKPGAGTGGRQNASGYVRKLGADIEPDIESTSKKFVEQFVPLVPQFTWHWGWAFLGITTFAWLLIVIHVRCVVFGSFGGAGTGRHALEKLLGLYTESGDRDRYIAKVRDVYIIFGLVILLGAYIFYVLTPCWIVMRHSPWAIFWRHDLWPYLSFYDQWSWGFTAVVVSLGYATAGLIFLTAVLRLLSLIWRFDRTPPAPPRGNDQVPEADSPSARIVFMSRFDSRRKRFIGLVLSALAGAIALALAFALPLYAVPRWWSEFRLKAYAREWSDPSTSEKALNEAGNQLLYFERAVSVDNGVSPLVPILLLTLVTVLWLICQLKRLYYAERFWEKPGDPFEPGDGPGKERIELIQWHRDRIRWLTLKVLPRRDDKFTATSRSPLVLFASLVLACTLIRQLHRMIPSIDFQGWTWVVLFWIWFLVVTVGVALIRFVWLWKAIEDLLRVFTSLPMLNAYGRVPPALSRTFGRYLGQFRLQRLSLSIPVHQWIAVARH